MEFYNKIVQRKKEGWGIPLLLENGSVQVSDGMVKVAYNDIDLA